MGGGGGGGGGSQVSITPTVETSERLLSSAGKIWVSGWFGWLAGWMVGWLVGRVEWMAILGRMADYLLA